MDRRRKYTDQQLELVKILIVEERVTARILSDLTGIPFGYTTQLSRSLDVPFVRVQGQQLGKFGQVIRAREIARLKRKYAAELTLFQDDS